MAAVRKKNRIWRELKPYPRYPGIWRPIRLILPYIPLWPAAVFPHLHSKTLAFWFSCPTASEENLKLKETLVCPIMSLQFPSGKLGHLEEVPGRLQLWL